MTLGVNVANVNLEKGDSIYPGRHAHRHSGANVFDEVIGIRDLWLRTCYFTDTLRYVHLGVPEHMFVVPNDN